MRAVLGVILATGTAGFAIAAAITLLRPAAGQRALARFAERAGLPVPASSVGALERSMKRRSVIELGGVSVALGAGGLLLLLPWGTVSAFPLAVFVPVIVAATLLTTMSVALHGHLSVPSLGEPRVARSRVTTARDYLGSIPRAVTWALAAIAVGSGGWTLWSLAHHSTARGDVAVLALVVSGLAIAAAAALPLLDARMLARPQPVGSELELAWDDALRLAALNGCRLCAGVLALLAGTLASATAISGGDEIPGWIFTLFVVVQLPLATVYPTTGAPVPRRLHPHGIHVPAGSTA